MRSGPVALVVLLSCQSQAGTSPSPLGADANASVRAHVASPEQDRPDGPPIAEPSAPAIASGEKRYSQGNEELIIRGFFGDRRDGFFVDVGAGHHARYSTTYYLEKHLGWKGVAIDALGEYSEGYAKNRPATVFVNRIVSDHGGDQGTLYRAEKLPEVSSVNVDVARAQAKLYGRDGTVRALRVPTATLDTTLAELGVERFDFLSMDIEEHEPQALSGFDIERFRPALVCIEAHEAVRRPILEYFTKHGYERIDAYLEHDPVNWYFRPREN